MEGLKEIKNGLVEFVKKNVNDAFDLTDALRKSYADVVCVHDTDGYHIVADTATVKR